MASGSFIAQEVICEKNLPRGRRINEYEAGVKAQALRRKNGISDATFHNNKAKFGGMNGSDAKRRWALEDENTRLKRMLAGAVLDNVALKELATKTTEA